MREPQKVTKLIGAEYVAHREVCVPATLRLRFNADGTLDGDIRVEDADTGTEIGDMLLTPGTGFVAAAEEFHERESRDVGPTHDEDAPKTGRA